MEPVDLEEVGREYDRRKPTLDQLKEEVLFSLRESEILSGVKTHSIDGRVKERDSFLEKVERKNYTDPFQQAEDLVGVRVVCLFMDDLQLVDNVVNQEFEVLQKEDKLTQANDDAFGYMSQHYTCRLKDEVSGRRYDHLRGLKFEIQTRTLLMDSWANVSHYLAYKGEMSIPQSLRRDFHALSALLYLADRQFQQFYASAQIDQKEAFEALASDPLESLPLDSNTLMALMQRTYSDRIHSPLEIVSEFLEELSEVGINSLEEVSLLLTTGHDGAVRSERANPPFGGSGYYTDVGLARNAVANAHKGYNDYKYGGRK